LRQRPDCLATFKYVIYDEQVRPKLHLLAQRL
jgi:hypothetical protein